MCELGLARAGLNVASYVHVVKRNLECYSGYIQASWPDTVTVDASQSVGPSLQYSRDLLSLTLGLNYLHNSTIRNRLCLLHRRRYQ